MDEEQVAVSKEGLAGLPTHHHCPLKPRAHQVPSAHAEANPAQYSDAPAYASLTFQKIWEMSHGVGRWSLRDDSRGENPLEQKDSVCPAEHYFCGVLKIALG